jgi:hypothetical protein
MKPFGFLLIGIAGLLGGCCGPYNPGTEALMLGDAGYETAARAVKEHVYAAPGTRLDDFERSIRVSEVITNQPLLVDADFDVQTNGLWRYRYDGKHTVYYGRFIKEGAPKTSPTFEAEEIFDPASLASKLKAGADPVSAELFSRFSREGQSVIAAYPESGGDKRALQVALATELNAIVSGPLIYDEQRFAGVTLRMSETNALKIRPRSEHEVGVWQRGLNRLLLEDAYPTELARVQRVDWKHWYVAVK